jgi:hypothetical protein
MCQPSCAASDSIILPLAVNVGILGVGAGMPASELGSSRLPRQTQRHLQTPSSVGDLGGLNKFKEQHHDCGQYSSMFVTFRNFIHHWHVEHLGFKVETVHFFVRRINPVLPTFGIREALDASVLHALRNNRDCVVDKRFSVVDVSYDCAPSNML